MNKKNRWGILSITLFATALLSACAGNKAEPSDEFLAPISDQTVDLIGNVEFGLQLADKWDDIIGDLKYGCIAINAWTGLGFLTPQVPWGAYPGHTLDDIQSGIGFVHNSYMFDRAERTVIEAPFRPFPRNLLHGSMTLLPKPPWFVTNTKADILGKLLTKFQHKPSFLKISRIFLNALLG